MSQVGSGKQNIIRIPYELNCTLLRVKDANVLHDH